VAEREAELGVDLDAAALDQVAARVARRLVPTFTALHYGAPAYGQLRQAAPAEIRGGAEDESEMGVWRHLFQPKRERNLAIRLEEYLRFGLEAGVFFES
jgi:hypothetical protein